VAPNESRERVSTERAAGMADPQIPSGSARFEVRVTADTHFGWLRTRLSVERTMMSWIRTAVSLIGFGFAIVQFFERLQQMPGITPASFPKAPQYLGLALISCGVLALLVSIWQYRWTIRYMWEEPFARIAGLRGENRERMQSPVLAIAALLVFIGLFAFFAVLLRQV
jgi:putative membrane protein